MLIFGCKNLKYLDDNPIQPNERLLVETWGRGSTREEKMRLEQEERERQRDIQRDKERRNRETCECVCMSVCE
jgi:hypothetical protein